MEKYKPKRLVFLFPPLPHFMSSFSGFHLNIKMGRELKPTHMTVVPVTSQVPHLPSFSRSSFFTWLSWGSHRVLLRPPWIYCVLVFMLGSS